MILESSGGSIDAAYNIGLLLRRYGQEQLNIIIPRWAKSAATVIACCGDAIEMTYISELGPVDPQITMFNPLEKRLEEFSPLDIDSTLQLIRDEFRTGDERLARGLQERLQFPLTLGGIKKSLEVGKQYVERLLSSRMLKECPGDLSAAEVAQSLVHAYSTHSFCIDHDEASRIGLKVHPVPDNQIDMLWELRTISLQKEDIDKSRKEKLIRDAIKDLPREFLRDLSIPQRATVPGITAG